MARYKVIKDVSAMQIPLEGLGAKLTVTIEHDTYRWPWVAEKYRSSSSTPGPSSSSIAGTEQYDIFLFKTVGTETTFLGVCSPLDMETWAVESPDATTGLFRRSTVELTFRNETILDDAWLDLIADIRALASALTEFESQQEAITVTYEFSGNSYVQQSSSSSGGGRSLTLTKSSLTAYPVGTPTGYRMTITCTSVGTDNKIFLHRDDELDYLGVSYARPIAVCSPGDLVDYPADAINVGDFPPHYRLATFDVVSADLTLLGTTWANIQSQVSRLAQALQYQSDNITTTSIEDVN